MRRYADVDARQRRRTAPRDDYPRYDNARYDGGWFDDGRYHDGRYDNARYDGGWFDDGRYHDGRYHDGRYHDGRYHDGRYHDDSYDDRRRRGRDPLWAKLCLVLGSLVMVASGLVVFGSKALTHYATNGISQEDLLGTENRAEGKNIDGPLNILLLGMDERVNSEAMIRTDSIIIVHITANHDAAYLVSLPRDTRVDVPAFPTSGFGGGVLKLTEAFAVANAHNGKGDPSLEGRRRGVQLMAKTINGLVPGGLKFNAVALINYMGFRKLVDALGGVDMCIDQRVESLHYDREGKYVSDTIKKGIAGYLYTPGCRRLKPWEALDYVRQRENLPHGDYDRQRHQQQFLFAVFKQLMSKSTVTEVAKFGKLRDAAGELLTLDLGGASIEDWIFSVKSLRSSDLTLVKTNGGTYASETINRKSYQILNPASIELMQAVREDKVYEFLERHPNWIAKAA
jgi:LCP family protein required for cell wall assembly